MIEGWGLGKRWALGEMLSLTCPTVREQALGVSSYTAKNGKVKNGMTDFYGLKVSAGIGLGADLGIFGNERLGVCILAGFQVLSIGFGVSTPSIHIEFDRVINRD